MRRILIRLMGALLCSVAVQAHEIRPAYLELHEDKAGEFAVLWKTPMRGDMRLALTPEFSGRNEKLTPVDARTTGTAAVQTWRMRAAELRGQTVRITGLESTLTDALVRVEFADGTEWTQRLTAAAPAAMVPQGTSAWQVAGVYLGLGVEHILTGIDHLLFILALIIITRGGWMLVKTVTAFTISHSITLTAAALGLVHIPQQPVEAVIALSIVFVAAEIVHQREGRMGITARAPWVVAFAFGLMHGLGFASGLSEAGLPQGHIPAALTFFSLGVEIGHFLFIGVVLLLLSLVRRIRLPLPRWTELLPPYAIGSIAMFWVIDRVAIF
jgi:hydrogenase/urease accessory protein HupE